MVRILLSHLEPDEEAAFVFCCMFVDSRSVDRLLPLIPEDGLGDLGGWCFGLWLSAIEVMSSRL